jgi:CheY-like chemotaxis protein
VDRPRTLRLSEAAIKEILDALDAQERECGTQAGHARRYPYRISALHVEALSPNGGNICHHVPSRTIARDGVSFLAGNLIYPNTACNIHLITAHNYWQTVYGKVLSCRYLHGTASVYEIEVRFPRPIDAALFSAEALRLRILLADDCETTRLLMSHMLENLNAEVVCCRDGQEAVERALAEHFDVVLMDLDMPVLDGLRATQELRARRCVQPIVVVSALDTPETQQACTEAGCDGFIAKPATVEVLRSLMNRLRPEVLLSSLNYDQPAVTQLVDDFVRELHRSAWRVQKAFVSDDMAALMRETQILKSESAGYGFEPISALAFHVQESLRQDAAPKERHQRIRELVRLCFAARPSVNLSAQSVGQAEAGPMSAPAAST